MNRRVLLSSIFVFIAICNASSGHMSDFRHAAVKAMNKVRIAEAAAHDSFTSVHAVHHAEARLSGVAPHADIVGKKVGGLLLDVPISLVERDGGPTAEVFGYHTWWNTPEQVDSYNWDLISTLTYASVEVSPNGTIETANGWPAVPLVKKAHAKGVKVVVSFALFDSNKLSVLLANSDSRSNLAKTMLDVVQQGNADGASVDFEGLLPDAKENFVAFMQEVTTVFRKDIPNAQISTTLPPGDWRHSYDVAGLSQHVDFFMLMGYDYHYTTSPIAGPVSPLQGWDNDGNVKVSVQNYVGLAGSADKIVLGCPYYGYKWNTDSSTVGSAAKGTAKGLDYHSIMDDVKANNRTVQYEALSDSPYITYEEKDVWTQTWFSNSQSLEAEYNYAQSMNLRGIGIWALGYDIGYTELWDTLEKAYGSS